MIVLGVDLKRNFRLAVINGIIFQMSFPFIDGTLILPMFLSHLTSSRSVIGFAGALGAAGWAVPQAFAAYYAARATSRIRFYLKAGVFRIAALSALVLLTLTYPMSPRRLMLLGGSLFCLSILYIGSGFASIAFLEVIRTSTPADHRGRLWGYRRFWGGLGVVAMTPLIRMVLARISFPWSYSVLFGAALLLTVTGIIVFSRVREFPRDNPIRTQGPWAYYRKTIRFVLNEAGYRRLLMTHAAAALWYMTLPFYILFFKTKAGVSESRAALYLACMMAGRISSNVLWAWINDRFGSRFIYRWVPYPAMVAALMMVLVPEHRTHCVWFSVPAFLFMGFATCGFEIGFTNVTLDLADRGGEAGAIGLMNTLGAVFSAAPVAGGIVIDLLGFRPAFVVSLAASILVLPMGFRLAALTRQPADPGSGSPGAAGSGPGGVSSNG
jgi:MFS family permease